MKPVGKPDAGNPHVRFDERRLETELWRELRHRHRRKQSETVQPRSLRPPRQSSTLLARWLREQGVEAYVMHPSSVAVSREHRRAKTDRLDTQLLMRAFLGWLRGERRHCSMAAIPTIEEEDAKRPNREHEKLVGDRTRIVNRMKRRCHASESEEGMSRSLLK